MALVAKLFFSLMYVSRKWHGDYLNNKQITVFVFFFGFLLLFIFSLIFDRGLPLHGWHQGYVLALFAGAGLMVANQFLVNYGFQHVKPFLANNILALETVIALGIGFFLYQELLSLPELIGSLFILISVPLMNKQEDKEKK